MPTVDPQGTTGSVPQRLEARHEGGSERSYLSIGVLNESVSLVQRVVQFDLENFDEALEELDRLHIEVGD